LEILRGLFVIFGFVRLFELFAISSNYYRTQPFTKVISDFNGFVFLVYFIYVKMILISNNKHKSKHKNKLFK